jgi:hypothetical protein
MKLTTLPNLVLRLRVGGAIPLLTLCALMHKDMFSVTLTCLSILFCTETSGHYYARFEVIRFLLLKIQVFRNVTLKVVNCC